MNTITNFLIGLVAVLHIGFLILEMFLSKNKSVREWLLGESINSVNQPGIKLIVQLAMNMGLYNGFLAAGLIWSLFATQFAFEIQLFFLSCIIIAGIFGSFTVKKSIILTQAVPAITALISVWFTNNSTLL
ncbi:DUF1304 domain-containing protein [Leptolyngbya sp. NK1-12]|uniref:DUF1304 domain-containing protein n=1 Tax=Leptolyngbya sp. NK1-12 TaxID=2547451 RepID=A0AA97AI08_9CYAN|nr:DUF1304 domain-containing protein [Leptolyngbya sp. NK1-12]